MGLLREEIGSLIRPYDVQMKGVKYLSVTFISLFLISFNFDSSDQDKLDKNAIDKEIKEAINKGVDYLLKSQESDGTWQPTLGMYKSYPEGATALVLYSLIRSKEMVKDKDRVKRIDAAVEKTIKYLLDYKIKPQGGREQYTIGIIIMALEALNPQKYKDKIKELTNHLIMRQKEDGCWGYGKIPKEKPDKGTTSDDKPKPAQQVRGDLSIMQYVLLGLWAGQSAGVVKIDKKVWQKGLAWLVKAQYQSGNFLCCAQGGGIKGEGSSIKEPPKKPKHKNQGTSLTMLTAGIGSIMICETNLEKNLGEVKPEQLKLSMKKAMELLEKHWKDEKQDADDGLGYMHFYYMYGIERAFALLSKDKIGQDDWYYFGAKKLVIPFQEKNGSFKHNDDKMKDPLLDTAWALLFLNRATTQFLETH